MSKAVYALRILVETDENMETVESHVRGWGEATFEGFILLELTRTRASLADIDTLSHTIARMVKSQETTQGALVRTTDAFNATVGILKELVGVLSEKDKTEEAQSDVSTEEV